MKLKSILFFAVVFCLMLLTACNQGIQNSGKGKALVGNDKDEHGCIGSAGYVWCEAKQKCLRPWEEKCQTGEQKLVGNDKDEHGCIGSAGYVWCEAKQKCLRPWEEKCQTNTETCNGMPIEQATEIAKTSECTKNATLGTEVFCNNVTKTWWFSLNLKKEGCSPACVVNTETKTAEINWRCTGLLK